MPEPIASSGKPVGWGRALKRGLAEAWSDVPSAVCLWLCRFAQRVAGFFAFGVVIAALAAAEPLATLPGLFGLLCVALAAELGALVVLGGAVRRVAARLQGAPPRSWGQELLNGAGQALSFFWVTILLRLPLRLWRWVALVAAGVAYVRALELRRLGPAASAALALALVLAPVLWALGVVLVELAFVRAQVRDEPPLVAVYEAVRGFGRRPWPPLVVLAVTGALTLAVRFGAVGSGQASPALVEGHWLEVALVGGLLTAAFEAFVLAMLELTRFHAFAALELSPPPAPPAVILRAELVVDALPVGPPEPGLT